MYVLDKVRGQADPRVFNIRVKSFVAPFNAVNLLHFIVVVKTHEKFPDHYVKTGTETSACDDANFGFFGVAKDVSARTCLHKLNRLRDVPISLIRVVSSHEIVIVDKSITRQKPSALVYILLRVVSNQWVLKQLKNTL